MPRKARKTAEEYTREELYARAEKAGIKYRSRMNKEQLFAALGLGGTKPEAAKAARGKAARQPAAPKAAKAPAAQPKAKRSAAAKTPPAAPAAARPAAPAAAPAAQPAAPAAKPATPPPAPAAKPVTPPAPPAAKPAVPVAKPAAPSPAPASKPAAPAVKPAAVRAPAAASAKTAPAAPAAKSGRARTASAPAELEPAVASPGSLPPGSVVPPPAPPAAGPIYVDRGPALPTGYGEDRLVALVRDPRCIFVYWELGGGGVERAKSARGGIDGGVWVLRLVKVIGDRFFDVPVDPASGNFYLHVEPGERYQVRIGVVLPSGSFVEIAASQEVVTPAETISDVVDEQWMLVREEFDRLIEEILGSRGQVGIGASELIHRLMGIPRRLELFSGAITSPRGGQ